MEMSPQQVFENSYEINPKMLFENLGAIIDGELTLEEVDGTYEIDSNTFRLSFVIDDDLFEIRNIEVTDQGLGTKVLGQIHTFTDKNKMTVIASNVKATAIGFWQKMGYQEGSEEGEYTRN